MKNGCNGNGRDSVDLHRLIAQISVDGDSEQLSAFHRAFEEGVALPCDAFVIGEPVVVLAFDYDGNRRRGVAARCRREDGSEHTVALSEVVLPEASSGARLLVDYRKWLGLDPRPEEVAALGRGKRRHKVEPADLDLSRPIELVVLSVKGKGARCRPLGSDRIITLRAGSLWHLIPGEIAVVTPRKQWSYAGHPYLSGEVESSRLDAGALGLVPLKLNDQGMWNPDEEYWGEADEPIEGWAKPIIARGPRPAFKMEQIVPGRNLRDLDSDPIGESNDLKDCGDRAGAWEILMKLCEADLRCLDAHAHLGHFEFEHWPAKAIRHFEVGLHIGEISLGPNFDGLLRWGHIDNRPFLRCMHGYGLCLWRLKRFEEAERVFERMLWLNPADNQGMRFVVDEVREKTLWEDFRE